MVNPARNARADVNSADTSPNADDFSLLFIEHRPRLWKMICYRIHGLVQQRVDPEDVLQEVFVSARKRYHHFEERPYELPFLWLRDVALQTLHNIHRFHLTAQQRDVGREQPIGGAWFVVGEQWERLAASLTSPSQRMIRDETAATVRSTMEQLSETDREIISMRHFEELTNAECAVLLELDGKAASIRYIRALDRLRYKLETSIYP